MAAKKIQSNKEEPEGFLNAVARSVGSTLGTIVATTEKVIENPGQAVEDLKARALGPRRTAVARKRARPVRKKAGSVRKRAASKRRTGSRATARKAPGR